MGDLGRAIHDHDEAIRLNPKSFVAYTGRGWTYFKFGNLSQALQDADRALHLKPDDAYSLALGDTDKAIADFRAALRSEPTLEISKKGLKRLGVEESPLARRQ